MLNPTFYVSRVYIVVTMALVSVVCWDYLAIAGAAVAAIVRRPKRSVVVVAAAEISAALAMMIHAAIPRPGLMRRHNRANLAARTA